MADHDVIEQVKPEDEQVKSAEPPVIPSGMQYDTPPPQYVAGTVVPLDTLPEDMTDAEYVQWMYENWTPFWAIKKNIYLRKPPVLSGLEPSTVEIGAPSFDLKVSGTLLVSDSVIVFAGQDELTQLNEDGTVSTGVNMGVWHGADVVPVQVRNGTQLSEPLEFTFTAAPEAAAASADEHEHDYEEEPDDEGKPVRKPKARHKK